MALKTLHENFNSASPSGQTIEAYKRKTLNVILYISALLGFLSILMAILEYAQYDISQASIIYVVLFVPFMVGFFLRNRLSTRAISILIISSCYLVSSYIIMNEGFFGATSMVYLTIIVLSTILMGLKEGIITFLVCLVSFVIGGYLFTTELLDVQAAILTSYKNWVTWIAVCISFSFLAIVLLFSIHRIQKKLISSLEYAQNQSAKLRKSNTELQAIKTNLELLVQERTFEVERKNEHLLSSNNQLKKLNDELERFNTLFIGREFRIKELRERIKELETSQN